MTRLCFLCRLRLYLPGPLHPCCRFAMRRGERVCGGCNASRNRMSHKGKRGRR